MWKYPWALLVELKDSCKRMLESVIGRSVRALGSPALLSVSVVIALLVAWINPLFAGASVLSLMHDPTSHPMMRLGLDGLALTGILLVVSWVPVISVPLAVLPVADLLGTWLDRVRVKVRKLHDEVRVRVEE